MSGGRITVNGQTWTAPEPGPVPEGAFSFVMSSVMVGRKCERCGKFISAWSSGEGVEMPPAPRLPEHSETECDHQVVDYVHDL